jgi:hypothetical protein
LFKRNELLLLAAKLIPAPIKPPFTVFKVFPYLTTYEYDESKTPTVTVPDGISKYKFALLL